MPRIAIFVDVQNIYYTTRDVYQRQFNYRKLWKHIERQGDIVQAVAYAIDKGDDQQRKFQDALRHIGFDVKLKPYIQRQDGSAKGDWDVGITIDAMSCVREVDTVILISGDGDFGLLLEHLHQEYKITTEVYGVRKLSSSILINAAQVFNPIDQQWLL